MAVLLDHEADDEPLDDMRNIAAFKELLRPYPAAETIA
jgi:hypothetical protein